MTDHRQSGLDKTPLRSEAEYRAEKAGEDNPGYVFALQFLNTTKRGQTLASWDVDVLRDIALAVVGRVEPHPSNALFHAITGNQK